MKTQDLKDFTVKICHAENQAVVVGTGFVVSTDGKIITCKHVVRDAIGYDGFTEGVIVNVCFPWTKDPDLKNAIAKVTALFTQTDDEVVLLELESSVLPVEVKPAILATAQESVGNKGEGKTSVAARWIEELLHPFYRHQPDGVFWWDFNQKPYVDEFFSKVFEYLDLGEINPNLLVSVDVKAEIIRSLKGRYLFILDGIEVVQHQSGDDYGLLTNKELCSFLRSFAEGNHQSFCLVTSRAPLLDLLDYTTYTEREVDPLSIEQGSTLLKKLGVKGKKAELEQVVKDWGGYALMLSLIAAYLNKRGGAVKRIRDIPPPATDDSLEVRVQTILNYYDKNLKDAEREMLTVLSAFRLPIPLEEDIFRRAIFKGETGTPWIPKPLRYDWLDRLVELFYKLCDRILKRKLSESPRLDSKLQAPVDTLSYKVFKAMITRLIKTRVLRKDSQTVAYYSLQPLIRAHYLEEFKTSSEWFRQTHQRIADYYLKIAGPIPEQPRIENILPVVEAVHHFFQAREFDKAWDILHELLIGKKANFLLQSQLSAWDMYLDLHLDFFPNRDFNQEPQVTTNRNKSIVLHNTGFAFNHLGSPTNSKLLYERAMSTMIKLEDWKEVITILSNLTYLDIDFGDLKSATTSIQQALFYIDRSSNRAKNQSQKYLEISVKAWVDCLKGDIEAAGQSFQIAEDWLSPVEPDYLHAYTSRKIYYADYLRKLKQLDQARQVIEENLKISTRNYLLILISRCYRCLGDISAEEQQHEAAKQHYQEALKIIRNTAERNSIIEILSARGRWAAKYMQDVETAQTDLTEALDYALSAGYRLYEADIRVGLAWMYYSRGDTNRAKEEAERARQMSEEMGYHWGQVDAMEVLDKVVGVNLI
ncbi:MAG: hypothetical protein F6J96_06705 [Symploca sp. SIO1C2]|nr:hypothetical protein [Symploca sp. SIO1C2]